MSLYQLSGVVTAPDGTSYRPLFFGTRGQCERVGDSILLGARERGEAARLFVEVSGRVVGSRYVLGPSEEVAS